MAEAIDIRELNERIDRQNAFMTNLLGEMNQVIVGFFQAEDGIRDDPR